METRRIQAVPVVHPVRYEEVLKFWKHKREFVFDVGL